MSANRASVVPEKDVSDGSPIIRETRRRPGNFFKNVIIQAFNETYQREWDPNHQTRSAISAFTGFQYKALTTYDLVGSKYGDSLDRTEFQTGYSWGWDKNLYNWAEQFLFLPARLVKNVAKLGT